MLDPQQNAFFTLADGLPLSALEIRDALLRNTIPLQQIRVVQGKGYWLPAPKILSYYRERIGNIAYRSQNDWVCIYDKTVGGRLSDFVQREYSRFGSECLIAGRFLRSFLTLDVDSYRLRDSLDRRPYHPFSWYWGYRVALLAAVLGAVYLVWYGLGKSIAGWSAPEFLHSATPESEETTPPFYSETDANDQPAG
jgi:hypothetical protein